MKKSILILMIAVGALGITGCAKDVVTKDDDPIAILSKAQEIMKEDDYRGSEIEKTYYYDDGMEEVENITVIYDGIQGIRQETTEYEMEFGFTTFNVKDGDDYFVYIQGSEDGEQWIRYKESAEAADTSYEYYAKGSDFTYSKEEGFTNVKFSNAGKERVEGKKTIKVEVTADVKTNAESESLLTRETFLQENGWTEEEVEMVEGFSVIIDDYIEATNAMNSTSINYAESIWVNAKTNKIVKTEAVITMNHDDLEGLNQAIKTFENECWQIEMIHYSLESGMSAEEAISCLEEEKAALEENGEDEEYDEYEEYEEYDEYDESEEAYPTQIKESVVEVYMEYDEIPAVDDLPEVYTEMTEEEYYNSMY